MKTCYVCGKKLKFWQGYYHPVLGKKEVVCSKCFKSVECSLEKYRNFILSEFKYKKSKRHIEKKDSELKTNFTY
jgi:hypothetical protein